MLFFSPFLHFKVCNMVTTKTTLTSCGQNDTDVPRRKQQKTFVSISGIALQWEMAVNTQHLGFLESAFKPALRPLHRLNLSFQLLYIRLKTLQLFGTSLKKNTIVNGNLADPFCPKYIVQRQATWSNLRLSALLKVHVSTYKLSVTGPERFLTFSSRSCDRISSSMRFLSSWRPRSSFS